MPTNMASQAQPARWIAKKKGFLYAELQERTGYSIWHISAVFCGRTAPSRRFRLAMASAMDEPEADLFRDEHEQLAS